MALHLASSQGEAEDNFTLPPLSPKERQMKRLSVHLTTFGFIVMSIELPVKILEHYNNWYVHCLKLSATLYSQNTSRDPLVCE